MHINMGKPINEKYSGPWRVIWLFVAVIFGLMVLVSLFLRNVVALEGLALMIVLVVVYATVFQRIARRGRPKWFLTDDGVVRAYASGEQELITWGQVQDMNYVKSFGLIVQWNKPRSAKSKKIYYEQVRSNLGVEQDEAKELISLWQKRPSIISGENLPIKKAPNRFYVLQGGKLMFAGFIGLIVIIVEINLKHLSAAILVAAITAIIFVLGYRLIRKEK